MEELIAELMPALERYEGKLRVIRPAASAATDGIQYGAHESETARKPAATPE